MNQISGTGIDADIQRSLIDNGPEMALSKKSCWIGLFTQEEYPQSCRMARACMHEMSIQLRRARRRTVAQAVRFKGIIYRKRDIDRVDVEWVAQYLEWPLSQTRWNVWC